MCLQELRVNELNMKLKIAQSPAYQISVFCDCL